MNFFTTPNSKNVIAILRIVTIEKCELTFLLVLYFHGLSQGMDKKPISILLTTLTYYKVLYYTNQYFFNWISLKGTWGPSPIFHLKWSFFIINQNGINKKFQTFTSKPQLAKIHLRLWCHLKYTLKYSLIIQNFATWQVREKFSKTP